MTGLPSLRALDRAQGTRLWLTAEAADMRCGFDHLAKRAQTVIGQDPFSDALFIFRSRLGDRLKILTWDRDGFVLWYKRLEPGLFKLPRIRDGALSVELRASELAMILDGIDMTKLKRVPRYALMAEGVRASHVVATDDTIMPMQSKGKTAEASMWIYVGDAAHPYNVFHFTLNRGRDGPKYFLKDYNQTLLAGGYDGVVAGNGIVRAGC